MRYSVLLLGLIALMAIAPPALAMGGGSHHGHGSFSGANSKESDLTGGANGDVDPVVSSSEPLTGLLVGAGLLAARYLRRR